MLKLLDFVNMEPITYESMKSYLRKHGIIFTEEGEKIGYEPIVFTKNNENFFSLENRGPQMFRYLPPTRMNERSMETALMKSQVEYRNFLKSCMSGQFDLDFVNSRLSTFDHIGIELTHTEEPFNFNFSLTYKPQKFEDYIDVYSICAIIFNREAAKLSRIRNCRQCGNYFYPITLKADFCGTKCRNSYHYRKNKLKLVKSN